MTAYKVTFQYSTTTYCTNIAKAESLADVEKHYSKYEWYNISEADESDIREAERKGMPVIEIAHEEETENNTTEEQEENTMTTFKDYFYGNKISDYGRQNGRIDYATFSKVFDAVLNNDIIQKTWGVVGEWEQKSGYIDNSEAIEEREAKRDEYADELADLADIDENDSRRAFLEDEIERLEDQIQILQDEQDEQPEVFQWYIIDENGARICEEFNEIVYYNSELDMYLWGVTHYGTSWSYVLTDIPCEKITA